MMHYCKYEQVGMVVRSFRKEFRQDGMPLPQIR